MEALGLQGCPGPSGMPLSCSHNKKQAESKHQRPSQGCNPSSYPSTSPFVRHRSLSKKFRVLQAHDPPHQIRPLIRIQPLARARSFKENPEAACKRCAPLPAAREEKEGDEPPFLRQRPEAFKRRCHRSWPQEPSAGALASLAVPCLLTAMRLCGGLHRTPAHRLHLQPGGLPSAPNGPQPPGGPRKTSYLAVIHVCRQPRPRSPWTGSSPKPPAPADTGTHRPPARPGAAAMARRPVCLQPPAPPRAGRAGERRRSGARWEK